MKKANAVLDLSERVRLLPVIHGSVDMAIRVREEMLAEDFDCLAVPLPGTWRDEVLAAIDQLPAPMAVVQVVGDDDASYVPIDPCQPVVAALRSARHGRTAIEFIDLETEKFEPLGLILPDPYALRTLPLEKFLTAVLHTLPRPELESQADRRARRMAFELHRLELDHKRVLCLISVADWPWVREAYRERLPYPEHEIYFAPIKTHPVAASTLAFFLAELPFVTAVMERARATLEADENVAIDAVKELVVVARDRWKTGRTHGADWLSPKLLQTYLQYVRNLTLMRRRLSPDLYTLVMAAKQIGGDGFALQVLETARDYPLEYAPPDGAPLRMGLAQADLPEEGVVDMANRLPGLAFTWKSLEIRPEPKPPEKKKWSISWNPYRQCSWPPEDDRIESFQTHVREQAKALIGMDLAKTERFTTSVKDGIDMRETLRHWHKGEIHVREIPPTRSGLDVVLFLFDVPADPEKYPWRATWQSEHEGESTIAFYATDFRENLVGPGVAKATYGGVFFVYPPRWMADIWEDDTIRRDMPMELQLLEGACRSAQERHVAVVSPIAPKQTWRKIAQRYGKKLVYLPLQRFSGRTVDRLRVLHVLNGKEVRSYAADFIRGE